MVSPVKQTWNFMHLMSADLYREACLHCDSIIDAAKKAASFCRCLQPLKKPARKDTTCFFYSCTKNVKSMLFFVFKWIKSRFAENMKEICYVLFKWV